MTQNIKLADIGLIGLGVMEKIWQRTLQKRVSL